MSCYVSRVPALEITGMGRKENNVCEWKKDLDFQEEILFTDSTQGNEVRNLCSVSDYEQ